MKKIAIMFVLIAMLLTTVSCRKQEEILDTPEDIPSEQKSNSTASVVDEPAATYRNDMREDDSRDAMEVFLQDLKQNYELRNMILYPLFWEEGVDTSIVDTIMIPKLKTDDWICDRITADDDYGTYYSYEFYTKIRGEYLWDGMVSISVSTTPNSFAKRAEMCGSDPTSEFIIEDSYYRCMYINFDGQEIEVSFNIEDYSWSTPSDVEQFFSFERYAFDHKNELVKVEQE